MKRASRGVGGRLARRLLGLFLPRQERDRVLSELEEFHEVKRALGRTGRLWYARQLAMLVLHARSLGGRSRTRVVEDDDRVLSSGGPPRRRDHRLMTGSLLLDLRATLRGLRRSPGVVSAAVLILALAIGVNAAVYSVADGVLLAPLPYPDADRLVRIWQAEPDAPEGATRLASPNAYSAWREESHTVERLGAWFEGRGTLTGVGDPRDVSLVHASTGLLASLGLSPAVGRGPVEGDDEPGTPVVILSHATWLSVFGGDPTMIGRAVQVGGVPHEVIGVAGRGFRLPLDRDVFGWIPYAAEPQVNPFADYPDFGVVGWISRGATVESVRRELSGLVPRPAEARLESLEVKVALLDDLHRPDDGGVLALLAAVTIVLLLGCLNTAQLLVARGLARGPELAVRTALGSSRGALGRMLLLEAGILSALGAVVGLIVAVVLLRVFVAADPGHLPGWADVRITPRVVAYLVSVSLAASLVAGWLPARFAHRTPPAAAMAGVRGATPGRRNLRAQRVLLAAQSAAAVVLLAGCALLVRSWLAVQATDPGFDAGGLYAARIVLPINRYRPGDADAHVRFFEALRRGVEARPGIAGAAVATSIPTAAGLDFDQPFRPADMPGRAGATLTTRLIGPGYFTTLGMRLIAGRLPGTGDRADAERVIVLNEAAGRQLFGADPSGIVGRTVIEPSPRADRRYRVIGIVANVRNAGLDQPPPPMAYAPWLQSLPFGRMWLIVRSGRGATSGFQQMKAALREIDPELPLVDATPVADLLDRSIAARRFNLFLLTALATLALVVAAVGVAGLVAFAVTRSRREVGIRVALGANAAAVIRTATTPTLLAFSTGAAIGLVASVLLARMARGLLFGVEPLDGWSLLVACGLLLGTGTLAALAPALGAVRSDPLTALRSG